MITGLSSIIGEGDYNTDNLIRIKGDDTAAAKARAYKGGGYEDWYLPNRAEASKMYKALVKGKGKNKAKKVPGYKKYIKGFGRALQHGPVKCTMRIKHIICLQILM